MIRRIFVPHIIPSDLDPLKEAEFVKAAHAFSTEYFLPFPGSSAEETVDRHGRWRTKGVTHTNHPLRNLGRTERTQVLVEPASGSKTYGPGNPIPLEVAAAIARIELPTWRVWHRTANRLAPPGVSVDIRDRSGARKLVWAFGGPHKPPFSVKSWRFKNESDALRKTVGAPAQLEPTERMQGSPSRTALTYQIMRDAGWTDEQLIQRGYYRLAGPRSTPTGRSLEAVEKEQRAAIREHVRENMSGILAGLKAMHAPAPVTLSPPKPLPEGAVMRDGVAYAPVEQLDWMATRWRQTTIPGAELPRGIRIEVIIDPLRSNVTHWRFIDADQARAHDAKQAKP